MIRPNLQPALIAPAWAAAAPAVLARAAALDRPPAGALCLAGYDGTRRPYGFDQGVAVIPVCGLLVDKLGWIGSSWITGYDGLRVQLAHAFADPEVRAVALDIDSPGGMANGCFDLVDWIVEEKARVGKPLAAICTEHAYSAAYAIASAADSIAVPRTGGVGSIGVYVMHWDYGRLLEKEGLTATIIQSGAHKTDGHPFAPLPDEVKAELQASVDDLRQLFAATVARNRGLAVDAVLATEARCYDGPTSTAEAVKLGLADAVLPPDQAFAALVRFTTDEGANR